MPAARLLLLLLLACGGARADLSVRDQAGDELRLAAPARRIISLAPHITELLFAAGAGQRLVGVVEYSDYPPQARTLPRIGSYARFDLEAIVAARPDLIVGWLSGTPAAAVKQLRALGFKVYLTEARQLADIPVEIEQLGLLAGSEPAAARTARNFRQRLAALRDNHAARPAVSVFYQAWHQPLLTVGGNQIISKVIELCGGRNVFAGLASKAPSVDVEAVLAADPQAIVASGMGLDTPVGLDTWRRWPKLRAVTHGNLLFVPADLMQRPTPRLLDGAEQLCARLEEARGRLHQAPPATNQR
jgi:iron complex transport system substrate-binding protein